MKITFCKADNSAAGYYRMDMPAKVLSRFHDVKCNVPRLDDPSLYEADMVVIQRQVHPMWNEIIKKGHENGCRYVYELDDDIFNIPSGHAHYNALVEAAASAMNVMAQCDGVVVSTDPLAEQLKRMMNIDAIVRPNFIEEPRGVIPERGGPVKIGFAGSPFHAIDFTGQVVRALLDTKRKYGDRIELVFYGFMPDEFLGMGTFIPFGQVKSHMETLRSLRFDIGIAPCRDNAFNRSKSNLKYLEYSINKTVTIASDVYPYRSTIQPGYGRIVRNKKDDWRLALSRMIEDEDLRKLTAINAYDFISKNYLLKGKEMAFLNIFERLLHIAAK